MNVRTAGNLIACHREGVRAEASVEKALKMSESDELLRRQREENAVFDAQIVSAIHCLKLPDGLRQKIAACASPTALRQNALHPTILCAIAGVLLAIGFGVYEWIENRAGFPGKENAERMVQQLGHMSGVELEMKGGTAGELEDWLMLRGFEESALPADLAALPVAGARVFRFTGQNVAQVAVDKHATILNIFRAADFGIELEEGGDWKIFAQAEWAAAIRERKGICTLLAFHGSLDEMDEFVHTLHP